MLLRGSDGSCAPERKERERKLGRGLRPAPAASDRTPAELLGFVVGDVELANALARVAEGDANRRPFSFRDFHAGHVGNEHGLASQCASFELGNADSLTEQNYAAARACRIFHERSRLRSASSSGSKPVSRALTTRKSRGRKSAIVPPSRYWPTTAGLT